MIDVREKLCKKCGEYWPADSEFFYSQADTPDGLSRNCKACYADTPSVMRKHQGRVRRLTSAWEKLFENGREVSHG